MSEEEKKAIREWIKKQINIMQSLIQSVSDMDSKKEYAKDRTKFKEVLNLIDKQNKVIDEMATTIIKERGYRNIDEHPEWTENTKRFFFKKVENDERREKFLRKAEDETTD